MEESKKIKKKKTQMKRKHVTGLIQRWVDAIHLKFPFSPEGGGGGGIKGETAEKEGERERRKSVRGGLLHFIWQMFLQRYTSIIIE